MAMFVLGKVIEKRKVDKFRKTSAKRGCSQPVRHPGCSPGVWGDAPGPGAWRQDLAGWNFAPVPEPFLSPALKCSSGGSSPQEFCLCEMKLMRASWMSPKLTEPLPVFSRLGCAWDRGQGHTVTARAGDGMISLIAAHALKNQFVFFKVYTCFYVTECCRCPRRLQTLLVM